MLLCISSTPTYILNTFSAAAVAHAHDIQITHTTYTQYTHPCMCTYYVYQFTYRSKPLGALGPVRSLRLVRPPLLAGSAPALASNVAPVGVGVGVEWGREGECVGGWERDRERYLHEQCREIEVKQIRHNSTAPRHNSHIFPCILRDVISLRVPLTMG